MPRIGNAIEDGAAELRHGMRAWLRRTLPNPPAALHGQPGSGFRAYGELPSIGRPLLDGGAFPADAQGRDPCGIPAHALQLRNLGGTRPSSLAALAAAPRLRLPGRRGPASDPSMHSLPRRGGNIPASAARVLNLAPPNIPPPLRDLDIGTPLAGDTPRSPINGLGQFHARTIPVPADGATLERLPEMPVARRSRGPAPPLACLRRSRPGPERRAFSAADHARIDLPVLLPGTPDGPDPSPLMLPLARSATRRSGSCIRFGAAQWKRCHGPLTVPGTGRKA